MNKLKHLNCTNFKVPKYTVVVAICQDKTPLVNCDQMWVQENTFIYGSYSGEIVNVTEVEQRDLSNNKAIL